jgi:diketogulonate reductase-like aldo/keto reductase
MSAQTIEKYPSIIYGTAWKEEHTKDLVSQALDLGFRAVDSANQRKHYHESGAGEAVHEWIQKGNSRSDLFLQSKFTHIAGQDHRLPYNKNDPIEKQVLDSFEGSLSHYHTDYLDSYLIHGPSSPYTLTETDMRVWKMMEKLYTSGRILSIGISNINLSHLKYLCESAAVKPMTVQNRCFAVRKWDADIRNYCRENGIRYQGFSLLTANPHILQHPLVHSLAYRENKTEAQVILRFSMILGMTVLTGTTDTMHMKQDLDVSDIQLSEDEIKILEGI